jgi:hypothetical protein
VALLSNHCLAGRPWRRRAAGLAAALACALPAAAQAQSGGLEYAIKANFLYKFGPFVDWPPRAFPTAASPFNVCVFGDEPFHQALDDAVRGQAVTGHPVVVRRLRVVPAEPDCQVLYVGRSKTQKPAEVLEALRHSPVLTVTDESQGVGGGLIHFVLRGGRVRFGIDADAARVSGLKISSKLMALAVPLGTAGD